MTINYKYFEECYFEVKKLNSLVDKNFNLKKIWEKFEIKNKLFHKCKNHFAMKTYFKHSHIVKNEGYNNLLKIIKITNTELYELLTQNSETDSSIEPKIILYQYGISSVARIFSFVDIEENCIYPIIFDLHHCIEPMKKDKRYRYIHKTKSRNLKWKRLPNGEFKKYQD